MKGEDPLLMTKILEAVEGSNSPLTVSQVIDIVNPSENDRKLVYVRLLYLSRRKHIKRIGFGIYQRRSV